MKPPTPQTFFSIALFPPIAMPVIFILAGDGVLPAAGWYLLLFGGPPCLLIAIFVLVIAAGYLYVLVVNVAFTIARRQGWVREA